jgi:hypothetical protein
MIMLHEFLSSNREELIRRCRAKVIKRSAPPVTPLELENGVPRFLEQLVEALRREQENPASSHEGVLDSRRSTAASIENSRTAALHGRELFADGYTVDQVVHDYGDICQAITELAAEKTAAVSVDEFRTFNRLLDNAISDAVSSFGQHRDESISAQDEEDQREWRGTLGDEQRRLVYTATKAFAALKVGNIGLRGATGALLEASLTKLRELIDKSLPTELNTPPKP